MSAPFLAVFAKGFRPFFLGAALFSVIAIGTWVLLLHGYITLSPYGGVLFWHSHEMLFGFGIAVLMGFLLTAVQNWTGLPTASGTALAYLILHWAIARALILVPALPPLWVAIVDVSFIFNAMFFIAKPIILKAQWRNIVFIPVISLFGFANALTHASVLLNQPLLNTWGLQAYLWLLLLVITLIAGRIFPMFTANGTNTKKVSNIFALDACLYFLTGLMFIACTPGLNAYLPINLQATALGCLALLHAVRWWRWRFWITSKLPLLWSLHAAYVFIPLGLGLLVFSTSNTATHTASLHALFVGAIGGLMLAMMARVALGHTGRPLTSTKFMTVAFFAVLVSALFRSVGVFFFPTMYLEFINAAGILWVLAFTLYITTFWRALLTPRIDGKPG